MSFRKPSNGFFISFSFFYFFSFFFFSFPLFIFSFFLFLARLSRACWLKLPLFSRQYKAGLLRPFFPIVGDVFSEASSIVQPIYGLLVANPLSYPVLQGRDFRNSSLSQPTCVAQIYLLIQSGTHAHFLGTSKAINVVTSRNIHCQIKRTVIVRQL